MSLAAPLILILALLRTPLFVVIAASAMFGFYSEEIDLSVISIEIYRLAEMSIIAGNSVVHIRRLPSRGKPGFDASGQYYE